jgi:hypothetical protein
MSAPRHLDEEPPCPDLGDLVIVLLAGTLAGLRDRLVDDGFCPAADLVADLVDVTDDYLTRAVPRGGGSFADDFE